MGCLRGAATARELAVRFTPSAKRGLFLLIPDGSETRIIAQPTRSRGTRRTDCPVHRGQEVTAGTAPPPGSCFPCSTFEHPDDRRNLSESRACSESGCGARPAAVMEGRPAARSGREGWRGHARPARALSPSPSLRRLCGRRGCWPSQGKPGAALEGPGRLASLATGPLSARDSPHPRLPSKASPCVHHMVHQSKRQTAVVPISQTRTLRL